MFGKKKLIYKPKEKEKKKKKQKKKKKKRKRQKNIAVKNSESRKPEWSGVVLSAVFG